MQRFLNSLSLTAAFGGLVLTLSAFAIFCVMCAREGFSEFVFTPWGTGLIVTFFAGVVLSVAGVVGLFLSSFRR